MQEERTLDLFVLDHAETLFKIWIIQHSQANNPLFKAYLTHASQLIDLSGCPSLLEKSLLQQIKQLIF